MEHWSSEVQNHVHNFFNHRQVNILVTSVLIFVALYFSIVTCLGQYVFHPLANVTNHTFTVDAASEIVSSSISLFFVVALGLLVGRLFYFVHLPPMLGSLLLGIALRNIPIVNEWLYIHQSWDFTLRRLAFVVVLIRCCLGVDLEALKKTPVVLLALGCIAPLIEATAVCLAAHFIFAFPLSIAVLFGLLLAAGSQAVVLPSLLQLQNQNLGTDKGIPSLIGACVSIDNLLLVVIYTVVSEFVFSPAPAVEIILATIGELVAAVIIGNFFGWLVWWFPRRGDTYTHLARAILLLTIGTALLFSAIRLKVEFAGVISLITTCLTAIRMWRLDSEKKTYIEEKTFATLWNLLFQPILFVLIGMKFDIPNTTGEGVALGLACLGIGMAARAVGVILLTMCSGLRFSEQLVFVGSFFPKATIQAALAPSILVGSMAFPELLNYASVVLVACIVAILVTSLFGQLFMDLCAPALLQKDYVQSVTITPGNGFYGNGGKIDEGFDPSLGFVSFSQLRQTPIDTQRVHDAPRDGPRYVWSGNSMAIEDQAGDFERYVDQKYQIPRIEEPPVVVTSDRFPTPSFMRRNPPPPQNSPSFQRF